RTAAWQPAATCGAVGPRYRDHYRRRAAQRAQRRLYGKFVRSLPASSVESPRVVSVNVAMPRMVRVGDATVPTSIFKSPVEGRIAVRGNNLAGDRQADLTVHGGPYKAIYLYPAEHYSYWADQLAGADLPPGAFGENLTTLGMDEN